MMKKILLLILVLCFLAFSAHAVIVGRTGVSGGNGEVYDIYDDCTSLTGWTDYADGYWSVQSGTFQVEYGCGVAYSTARKDTALSSVDMWVVFKWAKAPNAGKLGSVMRIVSGTPGSSDYHYRLELDNNGANGRIVVLGAWVTWKQDLEFASGSIDLDVGDYCGVQVTGTGNSTVFYIWDLGSSYDGSTGPDSWGTHDAKVTEDPNNAADSGTYAGFGTYLCPATEPRFDDFYAGTGNLYSE